MRRLLAFAILSAALACTTFVFTLGADRQAAAAAPMAELRFAQGGHARIPFDLRGQHVWVRGRVNGSDSVWIVVDTGASAAAMDEGLARSLELRMTGEHQARGAGGMQRSSSVKNITVDLAGLSIHRRNMDTIDLSALTAQTLRPMQLILGYELFETCAVRFDYAAGVMDVWDAKSIPADLPGVSVPMTLIHNHPYVEGVLTVPGREPLSGRFVIDTGSGAALIVAPDVAAREKLTAAFPRTLQTLGRGVGGEVRNRVGRAESFSIGALRFTAPIVVLPDSGGGYFSAPGTLGNIGGTLLERCRVTFDYPHSRVRFEPVDGFDRPFEADMSGAVLTRASGGYEVRIVQADAPAAEAGLRVGDIVSSVNGEPAASMAAARLKRTLQQDGKVVRFGVKRGADSLEIAVTLRRLI